MPQEAMLMSIINVGARAMLMFQVLVATRGHADVRGPWETLWKSMTFAATGHYELGNICCSGIKDSGLIIESERF